ncbi:MAG: hypothetical protein RLZZ599_1444 [Bacteroidota bacterium]
MKKIISACAVFALLCTSSAYSSPSVSSMVAASARKYGVPVDFAIRIAHHESGLRCNAVGKAGERGPLQVLPSTARGMGYKNIRNSSCATQIDAGMKHLSICYKGMNGNRWLAAGCHNHGFGSIKTRRLSKHAQRYANAVMGRKSSSSKSVRVSPASDTTTAPTEFQNNISTFFSNLVTMPPAKKKSKNRTIYKTNFTVGNIQ